MMGAFYNYDVIAKYIISYCNKNEKNITNLVLQKIMYYVQGYFLKKFNLLAFNSNINKWPYGPVVPDAYYDYYINGAKPIYIDEEFRDTYLNNINNKKHSVLLNKIIDSCMEMSASTLVEKTHCEKPWSSTQMRSEISENKILDFFNEENPLGIKM